MTDRINDFIEQVAGGTNGPVTRHNPARTPRCGFGPWMFLGVVVMIRLRFVDNSYGLRCHRCGCGGHHCGFGCR